MLALVVALISVISAVAPAVYAAWNRRSDTIARVLGPSFIAMDGDAKVPVILVVAINRGARPSFVRSGTLTLVKDKKTVFTAPLTVANVKDEVVPALKSTVVQLTTKDLNTKRKASDIRALLPSSTVTLTLNVEETGRLGTQFPTHPADDARGGIIEALVQKRLPD